MKKSIIATSILALLISSTALAAQEKFDLKANMIKLNVELNELQRGLIKGKRKKVEVTLESFAKDANDLLGDRDQMMSLLPKEMKNKKHKVNIAIESARKMKVGVRNIRQALKNKEGLSVRKRHAKAQAAYINIVNACFKCHNLVRDKNRL